MRRVALALVVCLVAGLVASLPAQQATFKASTEAIWVTATAIDKDGGLITDLTKDDFEVRDHGVVRDIITYRNDVVPFALSIMIDISGSMESNQATLRRGINELIGRFEPGDRAILGAISMIPTIGDRFSGNAGVLRRELIEVMTSPAAYCSGDWLTLGQRLNGQGQLAILGGSAIWDGIACGVATVASDAETPRRVALVITDGMDNGSVSTQANVIDLANRYGVMIYVIGMSGEQGLAMPALSGMSEQTGGGFFYLNGRDNLVDAFAHIAEELRHQYLFGFAPDAAAKDHKIDVRVKRPGVTTRSRRVYLTTPTGIATSAAATPTPSSSTETVAVGAPSSSAPNTAADDDLAKRSPVAAVLDRFERPDWIDGREPRLSASQLSTVLGDLRRIAPIWIKTHGAIDVPRRRLAVATFVLDLLSSQNDSLLWNDKKPASDLFEWACEFLRDGPATPGERMWDLASIALLERFHAVDTLDRHIDHVAARFPAEERWALIRGIAQDLRTWPEPRDDRSIDILTGTADAKAIPHPFFTPLISLLTTRYTEAIDKPSVQQEALVRLAYFEVRRGDLAVALARFNRVGTPDDPVVRYWFHLLHGRALEADHRLPDALASYHLAFLDAPFAQSATLSYASALVANHQESVASTLVARALTIQPAPADSWTIYTIPDMRFWPTWMSELRKAITP